MDRTPASLLQRLRSSASSDDWQRFVDLYTPLLFFWACRMGLQSADASDLVVRNVNTGAFQVYNIANNQLMGSAPLGQVGSEWQLGGFAPTFLFPSNVGPPLDSNSQPAAMDGSTAQLVQAMAGFDGSSGAGQSLNTVPLGADISQQTLLTTPQHA